MNWLGFGWRDFGFMHPWVLLGLLALPPLAWWLGKRGRVPSVPFPSIASLKSLGVPLRRRRGVPRWAFTLLALALIIVALARPRVPKGEVPDPSKGIDIMLALDFSSSMKQRDYHLEGKRVTRKEALIHVVKNFIEKRQNDRLGIVAFAKGPWLVSPLTPDREWALAAFSQTESSRGTAIGEGILAATYFLKKSSDRAKVIITVTDGQNSEGREPEMVIPYVKREAVKVYTILIGPQKLYGERLMNHDLMKVCKETRGQLFQASDTKALQSVYDMIDVLEKKELLQKRHQTFRELFPWLAAAALALVIAEIVLRDVLRRRIP
jgi:Ca-activated chloride channel homolog